MPGADFHNNELAPAVLELRAWPKAAETASVWWITPVLLFGQLVRGSRAMVTAPNCGKAAHQRYGSVFRSVWIVLGRSHLIYYTRMSFSVPAATDIGVFGRDGGRARPPTPTSIKSALE